MVRTKHISVILARIIVILWVYSVLISLSQDLTLYCVKFQMHSMIRQNKLLYREGIYILFKILTLKPAI